MMAEAGNAPAQKPIVYVVDDDESVRSALEDLLASVDLSVLSFGSTRAFIDNGVVDAPACLVLDIRMPGQSGLDFQQQLAAHAIRIPVIFITGHGDISMSVRAMKAGAIEFLTKPFRDQDLLDAIQQGIQKDIQRRAAETLTEDLRGRWQALTPGEKDVLRLVVRGMLNKQIAADLQVSEITVKVRRGQVMRKTQANSVADLVRIWDRLNTETDIL